jgi:Domain of unknown function (DUF1707)
MAADLGDQLPAPDFGQMRTSSADRERAIDVLKAAFAEGRLDMDEYTERVGRVQSSRTYAELGALTADLPVGPLGTLPVAPASAAPAGQALTALPAKPVARPGNGQGSGLAFLAVVFGIIAVAVPSAAGLGLVAVLSGLFALPGKRGRVMAITAIVLGLIATSRL